MEGGGVCKTSKWGGGWGKTGKWGGGWGKTGKGGGFGIKQLRGEGVGVKAHALLVLVNKGKVAMTQYNKMHFNTMLCINFPENWTCVFGFCFSLFCQAKFKIYLDL